MKPHHEEAHRSLRLAARDVKAFDVLKNAPEVELASICFHAQQAIEKSLKAILFLRQVEFRRSHDLVELAGLLRQHGIEPPIGDDQLALLNPFAVVFRYDEIEADVISRQDAEAMVMLVYRWARSLIETTE